VYDDDDQVEITAGIAVKAPAEVRLLIMMMMIIIIIIIITIIIIHIYGTKPYASVHFGADNSCSRLQT